MTYGEFLIWIGLWFFMGITHFGDRREFWSTKAIDAFEGIPLDSMTSCQETGLRIF